MAERSVLPNTIVLTLAAVGGTESLIVCLTQTGYNMSRNAINANSFCGTKQLPGTTTFDLPFAGQRIISPDAGRISELALFNFIKNGTQLDWTLGPIAPEADDIVYTGTGYLNQFNTDNSTDAIPSMTGTINADSASVEATPMVQS